MSGQAAAETRDSSDTDATRQSPLSVCHLVGSLGHGGRETLLEDIVRFSPAEISYTVGGLRVRDGHTARFEQLGADTVSFDAASERDYRALLRLARFLSRRSYDVVHAHGPNAQIPCRLLAPLFGRSAVVSTMHGVPNMFPDRLLRLERTTRFLDRRTVAVSNGVRRAFVGDGGSEQWRTIRNGIDVGTFRDAIVAADPDSVFQEYPVSEDDIVYLNIGRYVPPKAQLDLIEAMRVVAAERDDIHLFVVGGRGAMEDHIRATVSDYGLNGVVSVTGQVDDIHTFYAAADAFVSSSVGEGLPIVQMEAMAAGLPVVATDIPGVRELVVDGETGILVPAEQPERLAAAMNALTDRELRDRYGRAGFERVHEEFHVEETVAGYVSLYREIAGGRTAT